MSLMESEPAWPARQSRFLLGYCLWGKAWMMHNSPFSISDGGTRSPRLVAFVADVRRRLIAVLVTTSELVPSRFLASLAQRRSPRDCFHPFLFRSPKTGGARHLSLIFFPLFFPPWGGTRSGKNLFSVFSEWSSTERAGISGGVRVSKWIAGMPRENWTATAARALKDDSKSFGINAMRLRIDLGSIAEGSGEPSFGASYRFP